MSEVEYQGIKVKGGRLFLIFPLLGSLGGAIWAGFEGYARWVAMEEKLENPDQMIDFQTEYTKELHEMSDYPKIDFELIRKHFKEWEHHKVEDILTYRNKSFSSPVTGSVAPIHHTPWETAMDDSLKTFLNK